MVKTWPFVPTAKKEVAPAPVWTGIDAAAPPAIFVALIAKVAGVASVAVAALPDMEPVITLETVRSVSVPRPVMPEYVPLSRAESMVPEVIWDAAIAMLTSAAAVS